MSAAAKQVQAMQLREAGVSYERIAETVGYRDRSGAYKAVMAGLNATRLEPAKKLRRLELRRLDKLALQLWSRATGNPPDLAALDRLLAIMKRRAALAGLDVSTSKGKNGGNDVNTKIMQVNWDELYDRQGEQRVDPIEEKIAMAGMERIDPPSQRSDGQMRSAESRPPGKNGTVS
jgi:hypothetical protein